MVKRILDAKQMKYNYATLEDLPETDKAFYKEVGRNARKGINTWPLIFDENNNLVDFQEAIK
jgi:glutaredoxin